MGDRLKIMADNYLDSSILANFYYSTQNASYPASNILDISRGKLWRSNGNFEINSLNNNIVINDGTDKLGTLSFATYATGSLLASALQTLLNSISSNFTVAYSTVTNQFTISRTTNFIIRWSDSMSTINNTLGFGVIDDTGDDSYSSLEIRNCWPAESVTFDLGVFDNPKAVMIIDRKDEDIKIQSNKTVLLQGAITNSWSSPESIALQYNQNLMGSINTSGLFSNGKRYFRLYLPDFNNPYGYLQLGKVYIGDVYEISNSDIQREFPETFTDLSNLEKSISGEIYADERSIYSTFGSIDISLCAKVDVDYIRYVWETHKTIRPFFIAFDDSLKATNNLAEWTKYVRFVSPPVFQTVTCNIWNISMDLEEVI
jgi:hypothetical protein